MEQNNGRIAVVVHFVLASLLFVAPASFESHAQSCEGATRMHPSRYFGSGSTALAGILELAGARQFHGVAQRPGDVLNFMLKLIIAVQRLM